MRWSFIVPGQPPSLNDLYTVVTRYDRRGRQYKGIGKNPKAQRYHDDAIPLIRVARPSRWAPPGQIRVVIDAYLSHDIDADNLAKTLMDAIETATGINDSMYLSCWRTKQIDKQNPRLMVELSDADESSCHCRPDHGEIDRDP